MTGSLPSTRQRLYANGCIGTMWHPGSNAVAGSRIQHRASGRFRPINAERWFSEVVADTDWLDNWVEKLAAVTSGDVQRVANQYFDRHTQTVGWYMPDND